jgi:hypothetical protein
MALTADHPPALRTQLQKIQIFLAQYGFVSILKQLTVAPMTPVEGHSISGQ